MKIRNGFVSNSSSSSFIVKDFDKFLNNNSRPLLTPLIRRKLKKYGFKETGLSSPSCLEHTDETKNEIYKPVVDNGKILIRNYGYRVTCNEMDVIQWLVKNNIGFIAAGHYGHVTYLFHKDDKYVMVFRNIGVEIETYYHDNSWNEIIKKIKKENLLKEDFVYKIPIKKLEKL